MNLFGVAVLPNFNQLRDTTAQCETVLRIASLLPQSDYKRLMMI